MTDNSIVYLGDTSLSGAAGYLAGLMTAWNFGFDYLPSDRQFDASVVRSRRRLFIFSDYPARMIDDAMQQRVLEQVADGAGLLMIGGWESFCGAGGDWAGTPLAGALPVEIQSDDDRINCDQPALLIQKLDHPTVAGLPWDRRPPTVGGFNRFSAKADATVVLEVERFIARRDASRMNFEAMDRHPMLVVGAYGRGRTAALATDVAPHWVGGLVDWGPQRVVAQAAGSWPIEVGSNYARFIRHLLSWTGQLE